ncbi:hypothetical protein [Marinobacter bohaiensis]|uniref:hypothetical protein n=1 Tax=Marinobacter bohaiensis TaxID=2201898 RepID=UPI000DAE77F2|nr:hypothetical protein [Marinobacter bohaiensis]
MARPSAFRWLTQRVGEVFPGTLLVACLVVIAAQFQLLDRIQNVTLGFAAVSLERAGWLPDAESGYEDAETPRLYTLEIDQRAYERVFNQQSPLSRYHLRDLLLSLTDPEGGIGGQLGVPGVIAIDLDLSPNPTDDPFRPTPACDLTCTLKAIAPRVPTVLLLPQPVSTDMALDRKIEWVNELADVDNLYFGLANLIVEDGGVLHYLDTPSSFAHAICQAVHDTGEPVRCRFSASVWPRRINQAADTAGAACAFLETQRSQLEQLFAVPRFGTSHPQCSSPDASVGKLLDRIFLNTASAVFLSRGRLEPYLATLNFRRFGELDMPTLRLDAREPGGDFTVTLDGQPVDSGVTGKPMDGQLLMIGSRYGVTDVFHMMGREVPGSRVHLAAYLSILKPVSDLAPLWGLLLDLVLGVLIAIGLVLIKEQYVRSPNIVWLGANLLAPLVGLVLFCLVAYWILICWNVLVHPGPIVAGVMLDIYLERLDRPHPASVGPAGNRGPSLSPRMQSMMAKIGDGRIGKLMIRGDQAAIRPWWQDRGRAVLDAALNARASARLDRWARRLCYWLLVGYALWLIVQ